MDALTWRWMNTLLQKSIPTLPMWTPQILERSFTGRQTIHFLSRKLQLWCFPHFLNSLMLLLRPCSLPPGSMLVTLMATVIRLGLNLVNALWNPLQLTAPKIGGILSCAYILKCWECLLMPKICVCNYSVYDSDFSLTDKHISVCSGYKWIRIKHASVETHNSIKLYFPFMITTLFKFLFHDL